MVKAADGTVKPVATVADLAFSGGGDKTLVTLGMGANRLGLGWAETLPEPRLDGDTATYSDVFPGVDLQMRARLEGFSQLLVVKTPEAAKNPALQRVRFAVDARGLKINRTAQGGLEVLDSSGGPVFRGAEPAMWDSKIESTQGAEARKRATEQVASVVRGTAQAAVPGVGADRRSVGVEVGPSELAVVPDQTMLTSPATKFPVFIDPPINMGRSRWAKVSSGYPNQEYPNGGIDGPYGETGNSGDSSKIWRTFYRFSVNSTLHGKQILSSYFHIYNSHSWSCTPKTVDVWRTGGFSDATNWNNQPSWIEHLDSVTESKGYSSSCPGGSIKFNVKAAVADAAAGKWSTLTLGLKVPSSDNLYWKKFKSTASTTKIVTEYNSIPKQPSTSEMHLLPGGACGSFDKPAWVNSLTPRVYAKLYDADNSVKGIFHIRQHVANADDPLAASFTSPMNSSGREHTWDVPSGKLLNGKLYHLNVQASDGLATSAWSANCWFKIDTSNPAGIPTASSTDYPSVEAKPEGTEGVGKPGQFRLSGNGDTDITAFRWGLDDPDCTQGPATARNANDTANQPGGFADIPGTPRAEGVRTLYAVGLDQAGNWGSAGCAPIYYFAAAGASPAVAHFPVNEGAGTTAQDASDLNRTAALAGGATWSTGRIDKALSLNGTTAYAETSAPVVDTSKAFTVSAWARLQDKNATYTVAAQAGSRYNGFQLYYSSGNDRWIFNRQVADADGATAARAIGINPGVVGAWTHLLGSYDPGTQQIRLYVNGRLEGWASFTTPWNATGGLQIGRAKVEGAYSAFFKGQIDDVRVWQRVVTEPAPAPEAYFRMDEPDGAASKDEIYEGRTLTREAGATQTDEGKYLRGLSFNGTATGNASTSAPVVRTDQAFSVGGWAKLANKNDNMAVFSQSGAHASGFQMSYVKASDKWAFGIFPSDTDTTSQSRVYSSGTASLTWTHLMGVYDPVAKQVRLYVNGRLQGMTAFTTPWHANGPFQIGRTKYNSVFNEPLAGTVDDVKVWDQAIEVDPYRSEEAPHDMGDPADLSTKSEIWHLANRPVQLRGQWALDEAPGATVAADASLNAANATLNGATFDSGYFEGALVLDGTNDEATTAKTQVLRTDRSFSVAAWVFVDTSSWPANRPGATAVSQDGAVNSGFQLNARKFTEGCDPSDTQCYKWTLTTGTTDDTSVQVVRSWSEDLAGSGEWVHLVGVYDMTDRQLRLYVNGQLVRSAQVPFTTAWSAEGVFRMGTAKWKNALAGDFFPGKIDDVRVYAGALSAEDVTHLQLGADPPDVVG